MLVLAYLGKSEKLLMSPPLLIILAFILFSNASDESPLERLTEKQYLRSKMLLFFYIGSIFVSQQPSYVNTFMKP